MKELGVFINPTATQKSRVFASRMQDKVPQSFIDSIPPSKENLANPPKRIIVVGGDGSIRTCLDSLLRQDQDPIIGIIPGGTINVLSRALEAAGAIVNVEQFLDMDGDVTSQHDRFRPGLVEERPFVNKASFAQYERLRRVVNEGLRGLFPGKARVRAAYFTSLIVTSFRLDQKKALLDFILTTPYFGDVCLAPQQQLYSPSLVRASIEGEFFAQMIAKLMISFLYFNVNRPPPVGLIKLESGESFIEYSVTGEVDLDGDTFSLHSTEVEVKKSDRGFPVVTVS